MKKSIILSLTALLAVLLLTACSSLTGKKGYFQLITEVTDSRITYRYSQDEILQQTIESTNLYSNLGIKSAKEAKELMQDSFAQYSNIKGVSYKIAYKDTYVVQTVAIDYEKADAAELAKIPKLGDQLPKEDQGSYKKMKEFLVDQVGYTEVKDGKFIHLKTSK
ncbi:DUF1307 domain-containing protein [Streptococcus sp. X16XC17]|uniref:DUF1307 domain-containing protein n=1 Tax=unclassified Streptococcus TaxID=2608887 RepID=UPI00066FEC30|nr:MULTISPECIES: DUF1307 domain-containing protein [unclassified Streptococcus]TCD46114.1 DUF1307 domain-containing protein [Streptococcus sp. X16XC17]